MPESEGEAGAAASGVMAVPVVPPVVNTLARMAACVPAEASTAVVPLA